MTVRFHHAHLFATDLETSLNFYWTWFDAEVVADHSFAGSRNIMVAIGDGRLNFYDQAPRELGRNAVHHLGLQVDGLAELVGRMVAGGVEFRSSIRELPELDYIMVAAPDGVLLELFEFKDSGGDAALDRWFG
jgi:catechol 2,3-dioxygenase-like lactoylglutathione lyase family enzyme